MRASQHYFALQEMLASSRAYMNENALEVGVATIMFEQQAALEWALEKLKKYERETDGKSN